MNQRQFEYLTPKEIAFKVVGGDLQHLNAGLYSQCKERK